MAQAAAGADPWDEPPLLYSSRTPLNELTGLASIQPPALSPDLPPLQRLRALLDALKVPVESQVLVFSKTNFQNSLINPGNPRCLFFSENCYVGYVPGGSIEVIIEDPVLGPVFYKVDGPAVLRNRSDCLSCHATARTEDMPGMLVRSTFPGPDGQPLLGLGSQTVTVSTPLEKRWGGYYVTGRSSLPHLGNQTFSAGSQPQPAPLVTPDVSRQVDVSKYLLPTSDVVALLTLEHQCRTHNLLHAAGSQYLRTSFLSKLASPDADPDAGAGGRVADQMAARIVEALLFKDEAPLDNAVQGDGRFEDAFTARYPRSVDGGSLAEFQLNTRLFKNRCSYMIYSRAFSTLPPRVKSAVMGQLKTVLEAESAIDSYAFIKLPERRRIAQILRETLPAWKD